MKTTIMNFTKLILAVATVFGMATNIANAEIDNKDNAKAGEIYRWEANNPGYYEQFCEPENGVYGLFVYAADANPWDSQFYLVFADAVVPAGTPIHIKFEYRKAEGSGVVKFNAQGHANPHSYVNNDGWGELEATEEWQTHEADIEATGGIRSFAVNASIGREKGTLLLRNIIIEVDYEEVIHTKETDADDAEIGEAPIVEVPEPEPEPAVAPPYTTVDYAKIGVADASDSFIWRNRDPETGAQTLPYAAKYGDDIVLAFKVDTSAVNHWDVAFHVDLTSITFTDKAVLSFEYKDDYAVGGTMWWHNGNNTRHDGLMPWDADAQLERGMDWLKFEDALVPTDSLYQWEIQIGPNGKKPAEAFNVFVKNLTLTIDGNVVYNLAKTANPVKGAIVEKIFTEDGLIYFNEESGMALIGYDSDASITEIVIPNTVTRIADGALLGCKTLKSVAIPNSVTAIGANAFRDCSSLGSVVIPESVKSVGGSAFMDCSSLKSVSISESLSSIEDRTFQGCTSLTEVTIPNWVRSIGLGAFWGCTSLKSVNIPNSVKSIGSAAFISCISLTDVTIPESVTSLGECAFADCSGLKSISIPSSIKTIKNETFRDCWGLELLIVPNTVTAIGNQAFQGLKAVSYSGTATGSPWGAEHIIHMDDYVLDEDDKTKLVGYAGTSDYVVVPAGVTSIADDAFSGKTNIKTVVLPESVTNIGSHAFYGCNKLESVNIPDKVKSIGNNAFCNCNKLEMVTIPKGTETIGSSAFKGVNTICYSGEAEGSPWGAARVSDENGLIFDNSDNTKLIAYIGTGSKVEIPDGTTTIDEEVFSGCTKLTSVTIPKSVTSIGSHAFYGCTGLKSAAIPESVTEIGSSAFYNCSNLDMMAIPKTVTTIGTDAFKGVKNIINMSDVADSQWGAESVYTIPHDTVYMKDTIIEYVHDTIHVKDTVTQISQLRDTIRIHEYVTEYVHDTIYMFRSVAVNDKAVKLNIYPNPTPSYVTVECETEFSYVLTTSTGTPLRRGEGLSLYVVDLSDYADGIYLLYTSDGELYKIVKQ